MSRRFRDPAAPLVRALLADAAAAGARARAVAIDSQAWSSATFTGTRYRIVLAGQQLRPWARGLDADTLRLPRQWLGELAVECDGGGDGDGGDGAITVSALVLDEGDDRSGQAAAVMR